MELEQMSSAELISLVRRQEQELVTARAQQGGGELPQDERAADLKSWVDRMPCPPGTPASRVSYMQAEIDDLRAALAQRAASVPAQAGQPDDDDLLTVAYLAGQSKAAQSKMATGRDKALMEFAKLIATPCSEPLNSIVVYRDKQSRSDMMAKLRDMARAALATQPAPEVASVADYTQADCGCAPDSACDVCQGRPAPSAPEVASVQPVAVPKWIDDAKGKDPFIDDLIAYIEGRPAAPAVQVQHNAFSNAFVTLESTEGRYSIVMKFNQKTDAFDAHDYLLGMGGKEYNVQPTAAPAQPAAPNPQDAVDAALLHLVTNPRRWTEAMSDAWHRAIPDVHKAFADLLDAARANKEA